MNCEISTKMFTLQRSGISGNLETKSRLVRFVSLCARRLKPSKPVLAPLALDGKLCIPAVCSRQTARMTP